MRCTASRNIFFCFTLSDHVDICFWTFFHFLDKVYGVSSLHMLLEFLLDSCRNLFFFFFPVQEYKSYNYAAPQYSPATGHFTQVSYTCANKNGNGTIENQS